ncbi:MAG TPA: aminotransferase class V-fold PLP-dependent enzyme [Kineosporiaceae bacterium]|nr:aminotransferase class V-fold PLP-dependent enzyme [Kineosporiaceae bacterium]
MIRPDWKTPLGEAFEQAVAYLESLPDRPLGPMPSTADLRAALGGPLPDGPSDAQDVVDRLARAAGPGVMPSGSGRYFGFVVGGTTPAALAADWLAAAWDQNAGLAVMGPAAAVAEEVAGAWVVDLLGLPAGSSVGFVTGAQAASLTGLAVGLAEQLRAAGWDWAGQGLWGAPRVRVLAGEGRHGTIDRALRFLGVGAGALELVPADDQGRMRPDALRDALAGGEGPLVVCAQLGNVNSGALDPVGEICDLVHERGGWVHVDGAFGLWAAASPRLRHLVAGVEHADSWATDGHKWLNVPYDSGLVLCAHPEAHRTAMGSHAGYLISGADGARDGLEYGPDHSRRARGFAVHAALAALGRQGVADLIERSCSLARRFAERFAAADGVQVLNEVVLNQVLVRFDGDDDRTRRVVARVQAEGTAWLSGTVWLGRAAMRISVSNWSTDDADVDATVEAILRCARDGG